MSDPRMSQQFDVIRCKLCNKMYEDPRVLDCLHSFCMGCLATYTSQTMLPSENVVACPVCQDPTQLPATGDVEGIMSNTLLIRFINRAQKDKTTLVAGREVLQMSREALTESELKCPEVVASIQEIADTAGHILADNVQDYSQMHDLDSVKVRQSIQLKTTQLQVKAMDIVHCIDQVNQGLHDWEDRRTHIRNVIKQRSLEIQDSIRSTERRLISQLEDRDIESEMKNEAFTAKNKLHRTLRTNLALVDFLRLVSEYGEGAELHRYNTMATAREEKLYKKPITMTENNYSFDHPKVDIEEGLEMMFGSLLEITEETIVWDPHKNICPSRPEHNSENQSIFDSVDRYPRTYPKLAENDTETQNYTEINENGKDREGIGHTDMSSRFAKRQFASSQFRHSRRHPMKSISFDTSVSVSPYHYITSKNNDLHQQMLHGPDSSNTHPGFQILNEQTDTNTTTNPNPQETDEKSQKSVESAIDSLETSAKVMQPTGHRSMSRRLSAPPSLLIDTLNRRRLSALAILERSNINTEGLNVTTDIESGMNEARLEWLRENVRKKVERRDSKDDSV